ncbi:MAG TPA: glycosyltransferase family A protein [Steroidobacteraceae bacterium]|jgi:glycosyltransferase involved in cell wall biosynthesis|nr:glycosyltransferase family A protein [Steroidobacteraceae bacterium]
MPERPSVSAIVIFLDEERFLGEAIASVRSQSLDAWELLLVDDGSSDASTALARDAAASEPERIRYLEHPGHANRGMSAARNLGLAAARGEFVAFLDGDDVWLPERLERAVALLDAHPEAAMAYGRTQYWSSWSGGRDDTDWIQPHGFRADRTIAAPELLRMFLAGEAALPCMGSLTARREAVLACGGFVDAFRGMYEDQAFLARFCLDHAVYVSGEHWDRYRQHPDSACATAGRSDQAGRARNAYHAWLADFLQSRGMRGTPLWAAAVRAAAGPAWPARMRQDLRRAFRRVAGAFRRDARRT